MLTSRVTKRIEIPHEPGEWLMIRKLPGKKLAEARDERELRMFHKLRAMGGDGMAALNHVSREEAEGELERDPLNQYEIDVLLRAGIIGWSYEEPFAPTKVDDLDETTRRWAAEEILRFSLPEEAKNS